MTTEDPDLVFYTADEVAELLKVTKQTVYRWVRDDHLKAHKLGKAIRVSKTDLKKFVSEHYL